MRYIQVRVSDQVHKLWRQHLIEVSASGQEVLHQFLLDLLTMDCSPEALCEREE